MKFSVFEVLKSAEERLSTAKIENSRLDAEILLSHVLFCRRLALYVNSDKILSPEKVFRFNELVNRRIEGIPVAYLTGIKEFMGLSFAVNENVLIPRPETEILTEFICEYLHWLGGEVIFADLGTGSGAIAVSILNFIENSRACAVDISKSALDVAKFNVQKFFVDDRVEFFCGDLFSPLEGRIFDVVVSNPPYIPTSELKNLQREVKMEPELALDGGEDGLNFYRRIISDAPRFLKPGGFLAVEIGINQASEVKKLFKQANFVELEILRDLSDIERVIAGKLG